MPDLNQCSFTGRLGRDPESRQVGEYDVCNFSIAVDATFKRNSGEKVEKTVWLDCAAWLGLAKVCQQYLSKGSRVAVSGPLELEQWEDKQSGQKRSKHKLRINDMVMLDPPKTDGNGQGSGGAGGGYGGPDTSVEEDSIPFVADPIGGFGW